MFKERYSEHCGAITEFNCCQLKLFCLLTYHLSAKIGIEHATCSSSAHSIVYIFLTLWRGQEPGVVRERAGGGEPQLQALHRPHRARGVPHPAPAHEESPQEEVHILGVQVRQVERRRVKILRKHWENISCL